jgi:hypothetical protein
MVGMKSPLQTWGRAVALVGVAALCAGCTTVLPRSTESAGSSTAATGMATGPTGTVPAAGMARPAAPRFSTPLKAVESYLSWVSFAYESADSDVASMTFSPREEVRVNSYVQLNKERARRIRQRLVRFEASPLRGDPRAVVRARETWEYRYLDLTTSRALSPTYTASYVVTYTLTPRTRGGWIVDSVEATPLGSVK